MRKTHFVNAYFILLHALLYKFTKKRTPLMVSLGLTGKCNLSCPFCYAKDDAFSGQELSTGQLKDYIDQFVFMGARIFLLQGGEPLLRSDLQEIIAHIRMKKRFCRLSTNGVLVAERIDELAGLDQISFSLDGKEDVVDKIRGKGVYKKVVKGMEAAFAKKIPFEIHASLIRESSQDKGSIMHLLELAAGFKTQVSFCITCVTGAGHTQRVGCGDLAADEVRGFYRFLISLKKKGYPVSNTFNSLNKTLKWPIEYSQIGFSHNLPADFAYTECRHGKLVCWLDANNTLYSCPITFYRPECAVPVEKGNIREAWEKLGKLMNCLCCGGSDESTTFFALHFEDLKDAFLKATGAA